MNEPLGLALAAMAGLVLGAFFFVGLWWTVRKGVSSRQPALWFLGSFLLRTSIVVAGFYVVSGRHGGRLLACVLGFLVARILVMRLTPSSAAPHPRAIPEAGHAP